MTHDMIPTVFVTVEGGVVQAVAADAPVRVILVDFDTDGCDLNNLARTRESNDLAVVEELPVDPVDEGHWHLAAQLAVRDNTSAFGGA